MSKRRKWRTVDEAIGYERIPGLYRRWELERVVGPGAEYRFELDGHACDGSELLRVYMRIGHCGHDREFAGIAPENLGH